MSSVDAKGSTLPDEEDLKEIVPAPLASPPKRVIKHPLNRSWCMWYFITDKNVAWADSQYFVGKFDTIEDFWALYNHIEVASRLKPGCDYSLFREGIKPMWEDVANKRGGRWSMPSDKYQRCSELDTYWLEMLMMVVGESHEKDVHNDINGAVVSVRARGDRLALWTATSDDEDLSMRVGLCLKRVLNVPPNQNLEFLLHDESKNKKGSNVRALHFV